MGNNPQQADWSFGDISSILPYKSQINKPVTPLSNFDLEMLCQEAIKRFGLSKERPENNEKRAKRIWGIDQFRLECYLEQHDELMIEAYRNELDILKDIGDKLLHIETHLFKERSPIFQKHQFQVKILPFEDKNEFYQCADPWGIKRNDSPQKIKGILTAAERNTRERLSEYFLLTLRERENYEKFRQDLVEIDKLQWYMKEVSLQPYFQSEIIMNTNQKKTIPKTLVRPLLEGHEIEWAEITEDTLKEFPHLSDRLKLQGLIQFMDEHPIAREEALAQLHRKAKDPSYEALTCFFDWFKNAYDLKYKKLEYAMSQQQFDWKHSPANDLRRDLQQAQLSLEEISENKFLESSL